MRKLEKQKQFSTASDGHSVLPEGDECIIIYWFEVSIKSKHMSDADMIPICTHPY